MKLTPARAPAQYFAQYVLLAHPCPGFWLETQSTAYGVRLVFLSKLTPALALAQYFAY